MNYKIETSIFFMIITRKSNQESLFFQYNWRMETYAKKKQVRYENAI